jgi:hypothetical protein
MSQLIKTETKSPTMPKMQGKLFAAFKIEPFVHSLVFGKGLNPADTIVPSAIGMNAHAAKSAMGSAVSVPGFITGLCWSLCALAHGQKKLAALQEGLPVASAYALEHGSSMFKHGAGISAGSLETIVLASLKAMLALPAPAKRVTDTAGDAETPRRRDAETPRRGRDAETPDTPRRRDAAETPDTPRRRRRRDRPRRRDAAETPRQRQQPRQPQAADAAEAAAAAEAAQSYVRAVTCPAAATKRNQADFKAIALGPLVSALVRIKAAVDRQQGRADRPCCYLPVPQAGRQQQRSLTIRRLDLLARRDFSACAGDEVE